MKHAFSNHKSKFILVFVLLLTFVLTASLTLAHGSDDGADDGLHRHDPAEAIVNNDAATADMGMGSGPFFDVVWKLDLVARGTRLLPDATTDVWALDGFSYIGTFNSPCGDGTGANGSGVRIFGPPLIFFGSGPVELSEVGVVPSPSGSRANDVKVAHMNSGTILVHSNESCGGGSGGFEIWNVNNPTNPVHLASVQTDDINATLRNVFGVTDVGVHNLFLFTQGDQDYVAAVAESFFGNFQIFNITDPANPTLVGAWGAEELCDLPQCSTDPQNEADIGVILDTIFDWMFEGFGNSQNRFLHDVTISADGSDAYLSNWDAGLLLLDISDPTAPELVSVALDVANGSLDGEVNSHAAWPNADGSVVVETEEDFSPFELVFAITEGPNAGDYPAAEGAFTTPIVSLPGLTMSGPTTYVGLACTGGDPVPTGSGIAVIQRGVCRFDDKAQNAIDAGYDGMVVFNDAARGDALITMGGDPRNIPGVFVGHSSGLAIFNVATADDLSIGDSGAAIAATAEPGAWGGVRIWDYSDPENPVLASTYNTVCSASPADPSCDPRGTYTVHNVIVEDDKAYISWYGDGVLTLDVTDPYNPEEFARFHREGPAFEAENGGIQDVWGIYKELNRPPIYASDRNGGLYILLEHRGFP